MTKQDGFEGAPWFDALDREERERLGERLDSHRRGMEKLRAAARDEEPLFPGESEAE